ncbi:MAG: hypothetical protein Q27BPR15_07130 [Rhodobacter sp. CACIA14H1]|nr:MAG: hypothetical protein Q27BPR15_07130 [Rhodobacter sp. CACIA14H1]
MDDQTFETLLNTLRTEATATYNLADNARLAQYRHLANTLMVYRQLSQAPQLLDAAYRAAGIDYSKVPQNSVNYRPFLRLIYAMMNVTPYLSNKLGRWSAVLGQLDETYLQNQPYFDADPIPRLAAYIEKQGGITAMHEAAKAAGDLSQSAADPVQPSPAVTKRKRDAVLAQQQANGELAKQRLHTLAHTQLPPIAEFKAQQPLKADDQRLVALIARVEADGTIKVLASSCAADAVNAVAANIKAKEFGGVSPALAVLAETVSLQAFPAHAKPKGAEGHAAWRDRVFYDKATSAKAADKVNSSGEPQTTPRRLMLCGKTNSVVMSNMRRSRGVTIVAKPAAMQLPAEDTYLKTRDRWRLEDMVAGGELELMRAKSDNRLLPVDGQLHSHILELENTGTGEGQRLYFYQKGRARDNATNNWQGSINTKAFKAEWTATVATAFFATLREQHLDRWFATLGKNTQLNRDNNRVSNIVITKDTFCIEFNQQKIGDTPSVTVPFVAKLHNATASLAYSFRSKDLAPVFHNLVDTAATSAIKIMGNTDAMLITFSTNVAAYQIAIPTLCNTVPVNSIFQKGL